MQDKHKIWSEGRGNRSTASDVLEGLEFGDGIKEEVVKQGVVYTGNCTKCGVQWKMVSKWVEFAAWFTGSPVPDTAATPQGVFTQPRCRCGSAQRFLITWPEVKKHVDTGVQQGALPRNIYAATIFRG